MSLSLSQPYIAVCALALSLAVTACKSTDGNANSLGMCGPFAACGGDLEGTWTVQDVCLDNALQLVGMAVDEPACNDLFVDVQADATGSFTFNGGTQTRELTFLIDVTAVWTPRCLMALADGRPVDVTSTCSALNDEYAMMDNITSSACTMVSGNCECILSFEESLGGETEPYSVSGTQIVYPGDPDKPDYCVDGGMLQLAERSGNTAMLLTLTR